MFPHARQGLRNRGACSSIAFRRTFPHSSATWSESRAARSSAPWRCVSQVIPDETRDQPPMRAQASSDCRVSVVVSKLTDHAVHDALASICRCHGTGARLELWRRRNERVSFQGLPSRHLVACWPRVACFATSATSPSRSARRPRCTRQRRALDLTTGSPAAVRPLDQKMTWKPPSCSACRRRSSHAASQSSGFSSFSACHAVASAPWRASSRVLCSCASSVQMPSSLK